MQATHFIEIFKNNGKPLQGGICEIKKLEENLKRTAASPVMKTIAVWKIALKPGVDISQFHPFAKTIDHE